MVDDEPDVLQITKLALKNVAVYGRPLHLTCLESKQAAIEYLRSSPALFPAIAVALIDVVMESDTAGLELCGYMREELKNTVTNLYIRTGQPGKAPEREVIGRYDFSGYLHKVDLTEDKLYSVVKCEVRDYFAKSLAASVIHGLTRITSTVSQKGSFIEEVKRVFESWVTTYDGKKSPLKGAVTGMGIFAGKEYMGIGDLQDSEKAQQVKNMVAGRSPFLKSQRSGMQASEVNGACLYQHGQFTQVVNAGKINNPDFHRVLLEMSVPAFSALYDLSMGRR